MMQHRNDLRGTARTLILAALLLVCGAARAAAVTVSPTALFIDARNPTATLTLYNGGANPEEVEVSFAFGYPHSDSAGNIRVELHESAPDGEPSIVPHLRAFPRRMVLQPGQRQTLRVLVQAPASLAAGEYWGRVVVTGRGGQPPVEQTQGDVRMEITVETAIATAVLFRKGDVQTGAAVRAADARRVAEGVEFTVDLERRNAGAFLGRVVAELVAPDGTVAARAEEDVALYRSLRRRLVIAAPAAALRPGLQLRYRVDNERPDLPEAGHLKAVPVTGTIPVR